MKSFTGVFKASVVECNGMMGPDCDLIYDSGQDFQKYLDHHVGQKVTVTIKPTSKSTEKELLYAYYHKVIIQCTIMALTNDGWAGVDAVVADSYLKQSVAQGLVYDKNGDVVHKYSEDKRSMNKERLTKFVSDCIFLLEDRHEMRVPDSETYKMGRDEF